MAIFGTKMGYFLSLVCGHKTFLKWLLKALSLLRVLSHTSWGADRDTLLHLHHALILPKLEYGSEVYSSASEARLRVLDSVHHGGDPHGNRSLSVFPYP